MARLAAAAALALVASACAAEAMLPFDRSQSEVRLPRRWPQELALAADGSLWMTDEYGGVTRRAPSGRVKTFSLGQDVFASDVTVDASGTAWVAGFEREGRITPDGHVATWLTPKSGDADSVTSTGADAWFADDGHPGLIEHRRADGATAAFAISGRRRTASLTGITLGPDGALWFTQSGAYPGEPADGIGRMTAGGDYRSWPLPRHRANPVRIAAGPDGALWFTERDAHAIGRITPSGAIAEYPLATGLSPYDIKAGPDGALWFTVDSCIGRITTAGAVTAWPVRGAGRLKGIAPASDGSIWAADDLKSALWHFRPPPNYAPPPQPCTPPTLKHRARSTSATLTYRREDTFGGSDWFTDARIRIARRGKQLFEERVPAIKGALVVYGDTSGFAVRDLDGDGEPEVLLLLNWNGAHCCAWSRIYRYVASRRTYVASTHFWGDDFSPRIHDLDGDGKPELTAFDDRFAYAFGSFADSSFPIQIWTYRRGAFRDVTRRFPKQIRRDAAAQWHYYEQSRRKHYNVRGLLAAWAADEYLLGRGATVWPTLEGLERRGELDCRDCFPPQSANVYLRALHRFLRKTGYLR